MQTAGSTKAAAGSTSATTGGSLIQNSGVQNSGARQGRAGKYLIFHLGTEEFGAEVLKVREIMGLQEITSVPQTPVFVRGVINLRGRVVPVVDLRLKFGLAAEEDTQRKCIVVIRTMQDGEEMVVGMIVDGVAEVLTLTEAEIEDAPDFGQGLASSYLRGMAKTRDGVKILLEIDQVLTLREAETLTDCSTERAGKSVG